MGTALIYLIVVAAVAAVVFGIAAVVFGRGEELAPLAPGATPTRLPAGEIGGDDVRELRIPQAVRGYRMTEVDWVLDRLAGELDRAAAERESLRAQVAQLSGVPDPEPDPRPGALPGPSPEPDRDLQPYQANHRRAVDGEDG
ncbi:DivIVA domain-containing protein [Pseudonocardia sp. GCM10023141]|uniref:DivIVA domain-containing protein n=1 Tax=Pseudonocardia sp. GCM10023141 TaxID=3252653 RepID=UPI00360FA3D7